MSNMSYCRFENTSGDLQECLDALDKAGGVQDLEKVVNQYEKPNIRGLIELCREIVETYGDYEDYDEDEDEEEEDDDEEVEIF